MKYTIKHVDKFRENYELNPDNSKVVTNYTEEVTSESIEDFSKILKNFMDVFEENRMMNSDDVKKMFGRDTISPENIDHICDYYNFRFRIYNRILDEIGLQNITTDSDAFSKRYPIPYELNHFNVMDLKKDNIESEQLEAYYELRVEN